MSNTNLSRYDGQSEEIPETTMNVLSAKSVVEYEDGIDNTDTHGPSANNEQPSDDPNSAGNDSSDLRRQLPRKKTVSREEWDFDPNDLEELEEIAEERGCSVSEVETKYAENLDENTPVMIEDGPVTFISGITVVINMDVVALDSFVHDNTVKDSYEDYVEGEYEKWAFLTTLSALRSINDTGLPDALDGTDGDAKEQIESWIEASFRTFFSMRFDDSTLDRITH